MALALALMAAPAAAARADDGAATVADQRMGLLDPVAWPHPAAPVADPEPLILPAKAAASVPRLPRLSADGYGPGWPFQLGGAPAFPGVQPLHAAPAEVRSDPPPQGVEGVDFSVAPWFRLTHYCLPGTMASGRQVYLGAVAADQSVFNLGVRLLIEEYGFFTVEDRFAWDGRTARLDVWVPTCWEAVQRGVVFRRVFVVLPR
ncbi:MAG: 3D domain-containing protein [Chloroflexi bacterium]|nr:3D domain-containing protein [Chloroflexota bacterium]